METDVKFTSFASAVAIVVLGVMPASAVSLGKHSVEHSKAGVQLAKKDKYDRKHRRGKRRYRAGRRYDRAPRGWRRHRHRPDRWESRGCIVVGPLWYCP